MASLPRRLTPELVDQVLRANATERPEGSWYFEGRGIYRHTHEEALKIVKACLILDTPITDMITSSAWVSLMRWVADIDARS